LKRKFLKTSASAWDVISPAGEDLSMVSAHSPPVGTASHPA
jgi:hypothetical protein